MTVAYRAQLADQLRRHQPTRLTVLLGWPMCRECGHRWYWRRGRWGCNRAAELLGELARPTVGEIGAATGAVPGGDT